MEDIIQGFPHLSTKIFANLKNQDLTNCRLVRKSWKYCIDGKKIIWIRMIEEVGKNIPNFYFLQAEGQVGYVPHINLLGEAED